jgi:hypothetical protein
LTEAEEEMIKKRYCISPSNDEESKSPSDKTGNSKKHVTFIEGEESFTAAKSAPVSIL